MLRQLDNGLRRALRQQLHAALHDEMLAKLLAKLQQESLAALLVSMFDSKPRSFQASMRLASGRPKQLPRRPPGYPSGGRIVVPVVADHYIWMARLRAGSSPCVVREAA